MFISRRGRRVVGVAVSQVQTLRGTAREMYICGHSVRSRAIPNSRVALTPRRRRKSGRQNLSRAAARHKDRRRHSPRHQRPLRDRCLFSRRPSLTIVLIAHPRKIVALSCAHTAAISIGSSLVAAFSLPPSSLPSRPPTEDHFDVISLGRAIGLSRESGFEGSRVNRHLE